jgi:hypothetical protein
MQRFGNGLIAVGIFGFWAGRVVAAQPGQSAGDTCDAADLWVGAMLDGIMTPVFPLILLVLGVALWVGSRGLGGGVAVLAAGFVIVQIRQAGAEAQPCPAPEWALILPFAIMFCLGLARALHPHRQSGADVG